VITRPRVSKLLLISPASLARLYKGIKPFLKGQESTRRTSIVCMVAGTKIKVKFVFHNADVRTSLAPERDIFSDPAKSTKLSFPHFKSSSPSGVASLICIVIEKMEWERLNINIRSFFMSFSRILMSCATTSSSYVNCDFAIASTMVKSTTRISDEDQQFLKSEEAITETPLNTC
jgi:hypothetical protein